MDDKTFRALRRIVIYLSASEATHWVETGKPGKHIYKDVLHLARFLDTVRPVHNAAIKSINEMGGI